MTPGDRTGLPRRWVVTGGCGFIGSALIRMLLPESGVSIRVLDDLSKGTLDALPPSARGLGGPDRNTPPWNAGCEVWIGSIEDPGFVDACIDGADVVVHLAANAGVVQSIENPLADHAVNVRGTLNVFEAARHSAVPRVVFASSAAAVGMTEPPVSERSLPRPTTPYGASKLAAEAYAGAYAQTYQLGTVCLRFGNVYGPHSSSKDSVVARFLKQWLNGETLVIFGDGCQTRDFIFLRDLLEAVVKAATVPDLDGLVFQVASSRETSVNDLVTTLEEAINTLGYPALRVEHGPTRRGDVRRNFADTSFTKLKLGWEAKTDLPTGLRETVRWFALQHPQSISINGRNT